MQQSIIRSGLRVSSLGAVLKLEQATIVKTFLGIITGRAISFVLQPIISGQLKGFSLTLYTRSSINRLTVDDPCKRLKHKSSTKLAYLRMRGNIMAVALREA